jgi:hypothetical protein
MMMAVVCSMFHGKVFISLGRRAMLRGGPGVHTTWWLMNHKYRGSQQSSREVKPKFIDSTQEEPKNIYKP